jgi:hypothetical protein
VPELEILEAAADFGGVTLGDQRIMPLSIMNHSDITAKIELDIRDHPEFEIILPDPSADDDIHSEIMVAIQEKPNYELNQLNLEEVDPIDGED